MTNVFSPLWAALLLLALSAAIFSCGGGDSSGVIESVTSDYGIVYGRITSANGSALGGVDVSVINASTLTSTTNEQGYFTIDNVPASSRVSVIFSKRGYVMTSQATRVQVGHGSYINATMASYEQSVSIDGGSVTIAPDSLMTSLGFAYSGAATVNLTTFDPTTDTGLKAFPGSFEGVLQSGAVIPFKSLGYMDISVFDSNGNTLSLGPGMTAAIKIPIPFGMLAEAPATIALWYFDLTDGQWHEEGMMTKTGSAYEGTVSRFSIWSVGVGYNRSWVKGRVVDCTTLAPIEGARVSIQGNNWTSVEPFTAGDGAFPSPLSNHPLGMPVEAGSVLEIWAQKDGIESEHLHFTSLEQGSVLSYGDICIGGTAKITITLNWGAQPSDLDSHLTYPLLGTNISESFTRGHVYFSIPSTLDGVATLDTDDLNGSGPEIISIYALNDGVYRYAVHQYYGSAGSTISSSNARVNMIVQGMGIYTLTPPSGGTGNRDVWTLWDITVSAGSVTNVSTVNSIAHNKTASDMAAFSP